MGEASRKASPILDVAALAQLGADEAARRGLRAIIREGRKSGLDVVQVAGVTISAGARSSQQVQQQGPKPRRRRPKTAAQKQASKEKFEQTRLRRKLFAVLPIINQVMGAHIRAPAEEPASPPKEASAGAVPPAKTGGTPEVSPAQPSVPAQEQVGARQDERQQQPARAGADPEPAHAQEQQQQLSKGGRREGGSSSRQMDTELSPTREVGRWITGIQRDREAPNSGRSKSKSSKKGWEKSSKKGGKALFESADIWDG